MFEDPIRFLAYTIVAGLLVRLLRVALARVFGQTLKAGEQTVMLVGLLTVGLATGWYKENFVGTTLVAVALVTAWFVTKWLRTMIERSKEG